jgi:hypothetical protein
MTRPGATSLIVCCQCGLRTKQLACPRCGHRRCVSCAKALAKAPLVHALFSPVDGLPGRTRCQLRLSRGVKLGQPVTCRRCLAIIQHKGDAT